MDAGFLLRLFFNYEIYINELDIIEEYEYLYLKNITENDDDYFEGDGEDFGYGVIKIFVDNEIVCNNELNGADCEDFELTPKGIELCKKEALNYLEYYFNYLKQKIEKV